MKKLLLLLFLGSFVFTACEGPTGPPGPPGEDGNETVWKIIEYTVKENDWGLVGDPNELGSYFIHEFDVPELTNDIAKEGAVIVYYFNENFNTWSPLPYSVPRYGYDNQGNLVLYTESFSFDFGSGSMAFYIDVSDFSTDVSWPEGNMLFKIVLIY